MENRKKYIDVVRVLSMLAVVAIHVSCAAYNQYGASGMAQFMSLLVTHLGYFAVPCFLMISGALLLHPNKQITIRNLLKKYVLRYVLVIIIFGWAFAFLEVTFTERTISFYTLLQSFSNMASGKTWNLMWYMYTLMGIVLILPVLRTVIQHFTKSEMRYLLVTMFVFFCVVPFVNDIWGEKLGVSLPFGSEYCLYLILGYLLDSNQIEIKKSTGLQFVAVGGVLIAGLTAIECFLSPNLGGWSAYRSPLIMFFSVGVFSFVRSVCAEREIGTGKLATWIRILSINSFGIYLMHMFWINIIYKLLKINPFAHIPWLSMPVIYVIVVFCSLLTTMILRKMPLFKKIV